jgi:hypothetical protein
VISESSSNEESEGCEFKKMAVKLEKDLELKIDYGSESSESKGENTQSLNTRIRSNSNFKPIGIASSLLEESKIFQRAKTNMFISAQDLARLEKTLLRCNTLSQ